MRQTVFLYLLVSLWIGGAVLADPTSAQTEYYAVLLDGKKIGYAVEERLERDDRIKTGTTIKLTITRMGIPVTIEQRETHVETRDGRPLSFDTTQDMSVMRIVSRGTIEGGVLTLTTTSMGQPQQQKMPWPKGAVLAEGLRLQTLQHGLDPGTEFSVPTFQPSLMRDVILHIKVGDKQDVDLLGRMLRLTAVESRYQAAGAGEITSTSYVNDDLRPEKTVMSMMGLDMEMVACAKEFALAKVESVDLLDRMLVKSPEPLKDIHRFKAVTYTLQNTKTQGAVTLPETDNQTVRAEPGGRLLLTVRPCQPRAGTPFPYTGQDAELRAALTSNPYLQIDRLEVKKLAEKAVAGARDTAQAVRQIEAFVADYIEDKDLSVGYATAAEVCQSRQGDCTEHAVLAAALCRAAGIPAQVVVGIVYVERFGTYRNVFGGHAWTQAHVGGQWVGLDAAFRGTGRQGFGPGHIALAVGNGEPGDFFGMMGSLGQFSIDSVTAVP